MEKSRTLLGYNLVGIFTWLLIVSIFAMSIYLVYEETKSNPRAVKLDLGRAYIGISDASIKSITQGIVHATEQDAELNKAYAISNITSGYSSGDPALVLSKSVHGIWPTMLRVLGIGPYSKKGFSWNKIDPDDSSDGNTPGPSEGSGEGSV